MVRRSLLKQIPIFLIVLALVNILLAACGGGSTTNRTTVPSKTTPQLQINYSLPPWWTDNTGKRVDCDKYNYVYGVPGVNPATIKPLATWRGFESCAPLPVLVPASQPDNYVYFYPRASREQEFECTELVKRYLYMAYGLKPLGNTNGNQIVDNYTDPTKELGTPFHKVPNDGTIQMTPVEGDVLSYSLNHTAIVTGVNADGSINVIQQNVAWAGIPRPTETLQIRSGVIQPSTYGAGSVISWMTMRNIEAVLGASTQTPSPIPSPTPSPTPTPTPTATPTPTPTPSPTPTPTPTATPTPTPTPSPTPTTSTQSVQVNADVQWVNTGITLSAGNTLAISATGFWSAGPIGGFTTPDGYTQPYPDNFLNLTDLGVCASCASTDTPYWGALIGYIGNNPPAAGSYTSTSVLPDAQQVFRIGSAFQSSTLPAGTLWLAFNDDAYSANTGDNAGQVVATITLTLSQASSLTGHNPSPNLIQIDPASNVPGRRRQERVI